MALPIAVKPPQAQFDGFGPAQPGAPADFDHFVPAPGGMAQMASRFPARVADWAQAVAMPAQRALVSTYDDLKDGVEATGRGDLTAAANLVAARPVMNGVKAGYDIVLGLSRQVQKTLESPPLVNGDLSVPAKDFADYRKMIAMAADPAIATVSLATASGASRGLQLPGAVIDVGFLYRGAAADRPITIRSADTAELDKLRAEGEITHERGRLCKVIWKQEPKIVEVLFAKDNADTKAVTRDLIADLALAMSCPMLKNPNEAASVARARAAQAARAPVNPTNTGKSAQSLLSRFSLFQPAAPLFVRTDDDED